jgi:hypothetical protein
MSPPLVEEPLSLCAAPGPVRHPADKFAEVTDIRVGRRLPAASGGHGTDPANPLQETAFFAMWTDRIVEKCSRRHTVLIQAFAGIAQPFDLESRGGEPRGER